MSRFNNNEFSSASNYCRPAYDTINRAGKASYSVNDDFAFVSMLLSSFAKDQFYRSADQTFEKIREFFYDNRIDPEFAAKAALFARNEFGMRSISHVVAANIAFFVKGESWTKNFFKNIVHRPDDMMEILAAYFSIFGKNAPIPNAMKKGFASVLENLNDYQAAKYKNSGNGISLIDIVNLMHPRATDTLNALMTNKLESAETWGVMLSISDDKNSVWKRLLSENKLGYMALVKNLRNISNVGDKETIDLACKALINEDAIKKSLILPFRFVTAYKQLHAANGNVKLLVNLQKALDLSMSNVPSFDGRTAIILDESSSMEGNPIEIGSLFAAILAKRNDSDLIMFSSFARFKRINPCGAIVDIVKDIKSDLIYGGTNLSSAIELINTSKNRYERFIILSDMQTWEEGDYDLNASMKKYGKRPFVYSFDLTGYGTSEFNPKDKKTFLLSGFSEKIFDIMKLCEEDKDALVNKIKSINL